MLFRSSFQILSHPAVRVLDIRPAAAGVPILCFERLEPSQHLQPHPLPKRWKSTTATRSKEPKKKKQQKSSALKDTIRMPRTEMPLSMKGVLEREAMVRRTFEHDSLYRWQEADGQRTESFVLHDGPPYANGSPHVGHALNKILKVGRAVFYVSGSFFWGGEAGVTYGPDKHGKQWVELLSTLNLIINVPLFTPLLRWLSGHNSPLENPSRIQSSLYSGLGLSRFAHRIESPPRGL